MINEIINIYHLIYKNIYFRVRYTYHIILADKTFASTVITIFILLS